jgi:tRNA1(Val) A37 N6-methylase TrmN6
MAQMIDVTAGRVFDPACGSGGLLMAVRRAAENSSKISFFGNDLNPRMVRAAKTNFFLHGLDPANVLEGDGLQLDRIMMETVGQAIADQAPWWDAVANGPFDAVVANPPFAGFEADDANLRRIETSLRSDGSLRSLNRTLPFIESIVASLAIGGVAALVIPTSILNAEEESFVRLRELLLNKVELLAIIGLPEKAFVHTDCGVHGALLFLKRVKRPRTSYDVFVAWAKHLGYDRLGRPRRENDFPQIVREYRSRQWPDANTFAISLLTEHGRWDPAWLHVVRSLPTHSAGSDDHLRLTEILEIRDARISRRDIEDDGLYRYFEVGDADLHSGRVVSIHEVSGFELRKKGRIKNRVRAGDVLLPNHRDSLIAKGAPTGRSAVIVTEAEDGVLTTDRFLVLHPAIDALLLRVILNSAGVRRQIVAQCRGAASLDIRDRILEQVLIPIALLEGEPSKEVGAAAKRLDDLRTELEEARDKLASLVEDAFGVHTGDFRPAGSAHL